MHAICTSKRLSYYLSSVDAIVYINIEHVVIIPDYAYALMCKKCVSSFLIRFVIEYQNNFDVFILYLR